MGAVQKLATVVIIGLVALATALTVYIADEPNRRDGEGEEQDVVAIERATDLYIQYCLQCHGPHGAGRAGGDNRIGGVLNQAYGEGVVVYQSDDPGAQAEAEAWARYRITYGVPSDPIATEKVMPAFGTELNVEEINDLVYLIMYGNWDYVYNESVIATGENQHDAECTATPDLEGCGEEHGEVDPLYPTVPPTPVQEGEDASSDQNAASGESASNAEQGDAAAAVAAQDPAKWSVTELTVKPGDTIQVTNEGVLPHDFTVDELGIAEPLEGGASVTVTIPADAAPGTYTFYCSVPGHREAGMEGTLTIEAP